MTNNYRRIWWIASYPKSGNTWMRLFVNAYVTGFPVNLNSAWQYATGDLQPHAYQLTAAKPITEMDDVACVYYRPAVLMNHIFMSHSLDVTLKTHHAKVEIDGMPLIPPRLTKGALYLIRDPRDVAISFADHMGIDIDAAIERLACNDQIIEKSNSKLFHFLLSWSSHVDSWTVHNTDVRTSVVRYEDLTRDPEQYFRAALKALGIDATDESRFRFAMEQTEFSRLKELEAGDGFKEVGKGDCFFRAGTAGGWRDVLTPEQAGRIETSHCETMRRHGYFR